jgi:hypothetical protein
VCDVVVGPLGATLAADGDLEWLWRDVGASGLCRCSSSPERSAFNRIFFVSGLEIWMIFLGCGP